MELRQTCRLEPVLSDLEHAFPSTQDAAMFVLALGKPKDLLVSRIPQVFWQRDVRMWIGEDYENRLTRVKEAYKLLRPNDWRPKTW